LFVQAVFPKREISSTIRTLETFSSELAFMGY
jgi:hypothetical protein